MKYGPRSEPGCVGDRSSERSTRPTMNGMPPPQQSYSWVWYFVVLGVLTVAACTILVWYNLRQQLKKEDLQAARAQWQQNRPSDYDLTYTKRGSASGIFFVKVRNGK